MLTSSSPWLFAGCHVLLRQSVPGHPPCALISLITFQKVCRPLSECCFAFLCLLLSLFAFSRSVQLSRCVSAIPEDDIVLRLSRQSVSLLCRSRSGCQTASCRCWSDSYPAPMRSPSVPLLLTYSPAWSRPRAMSSAKNSCLPRKEVIQPHLPIRLPCYDFTPVIDLTFGSWSLAVTSLTSGALNSHGVTGGVYKARERIHRDMLIRDY